MAERNAMPQSRGRTCFGTTSAFNHETNPRGEGVLPSIAPQGAFRVQTGNDGPRD